MNDGCVRNPQLAKVLTGEPPGRDEAIEERQGLPFQLALRMLIFIAWLQARQVMNEQDETSAGLASRTNRPGQVERVDDVEPLLFLLPGARRLDDHFDPFTQRLDETCVVEIPT